MMPDGTMLQPLSGSSCSTDYVEIPGTPEPSLNLVNMVVRPFLLTKLSLFTKTSLNKKYDMKKGAGVCSLNRVFH